MDKYCGLDVGDQVEVTIYGTIEICTAVGFHKNPEKCTLQGKDGRTFYYITNWCKKIG